MSTLFDNPGRSVTLKFRKLASSLRQHRHRFLQMSTHSSNQHTSRSVHRVASRTVESDDSDNDCIYTTYGRVPLEIVDIILSHLPKHELTTFCYTSRSYYHLAAAHLYRTVYINSLAQLHLFTRTMASAEHSERISRSLQRTHTLVIHGPRAERQSRTLVKAIMAVSSTTSSGKDLLPRLSRLELFDVALSAARNLSLTIPSGRKPFLQNVTEISVELPLQSMARAPCSFAEMGMLKLKKAKLVYAIGYPWYTWTSHLLSGQPDLSYLRLEVGRNYAYSHYPEWHADHIEQRERYATPLVPILVSFAEQGKFATLAAITIGFEEDQQALAEEVQRKIEMMKKQHQIGFKVKIDEAEVCKNIKAPLEVA